MEPFGGEVRSGGGGGGTLEGGHLQVEGGKQLRGCLSGAGPNDALAPRRMPTKRDERGAAVARLRETCIRRGRHVKLTHSINILQALLHSSHSFREAKEPWPPPAVS